MNKLALVLGWVVLICIAEPALAQLAMTAPVQISTNAGAHSPTMHVGRDGSIYVSWFERNANIYFSHSTDRGQTFSTPVPVSNQGQWATQWTSELQRSPEFAIDTKGVIHLVWAEARVTSASDVWYVRSTDSGKTWSQPLSIMDPGDSASFSQDFAVIACDSSDNLYVSYLDNRQIMAKTGKHYKMQLERSTNGGLSWSLPVIADKLAFDTSGTCECCRQDIAVSPDGHVYIAFRTSMNTPLGDMRDIFICRSWDGGQTFEPSIQCQLGDWKLEDCPSKGPHISLDPHENLFVAWNDQRDDSGKLIAYFGLLPKGRSNVLPNYSISNSQTQTGHWPYVTVSPNGIIAYAFMPNASLGQPVQFTYSSDGGNTWNRSRSLPGPSGDGQYLPHLSFGSNGDVYAAWQDGNANGILFSRISGLNSPVTPDPVVLSENLPSYNSALPVQLHWSPSQNLLRGNFVWYHFQAGTGTTVLFDTILRDTSIRLGVLPPGQYIYSVTTHTSIDSATSGRAFSIEALGVPSIPEKRLQATATPNPTQSQIVALSLPDAMNTQTAITVSDEAGKTVLTTTNTVVDGSVMLDLRGFPNGAYHVSIAQRSMTWNVAIVLRH
ncbi:MAG: hypothetical protein Q8922_08155 [Bacteroidota bacterium]|nr:hypothetical protein [Bacteroidota bacterium]MDP4234196.1 hypothetical protein [Bacteroidota bacterium]MDP4243738.1 hypothetical protein [Bacteroidota bacterium]MDP4287897.1 hypothetical protein [Bacteroidota bacterium]